MALLREWLLDQKELLDNPFDYYHMELDRPFYEEDGRLIDFISQNQNIETKKSPTFFILSIFPA